MHSGRLLIVNDILGYKNRIKINLPANKTLFSATFATTAGIVPVLKSAINLNT